MEGEKRMPKPNRMNAADVVGGIFFLVLGPVLVYASLQMKVYRSFLDAPGFFPMILGIIFTIMGGILLNTAIKRNGIEELKQVIRNKEISKGLRSDTALRAFVLVILMAVYIFGLVGRVNFTVATFVYLTVTMLYLKSTSKVNIFLISLVASLAISYTFSNLFSIPLP